MSTYKNLNRKDLLLKLKVLVAVTLGAEFPLLATGMMSPLVFPFGTFDMHRVKAGETSFSGVLYLTWAVQPEAKILNVGSVREATDDELRAALAYYTTAVQSLRESIREMVLSRSFFEGLKRQASATRTFIG